MASCFGRSVCGWCFVCECPVLYGFLLQWIRLGVVGAEGRGQTEDGQTHFLNHFRQSCHLLVPFWLGSMSHGCVRPTFPTISRMGKKTTSCSVSKQAEFCSVSICRASLLTLNPATSLVLENLFSSLAYHVKFGPINTLQMGNFDDPLSVGLSATAALPELD